MGAVTGIEWCEHTFNPWRGCTKISEGCRFCYAETMSGRNPGTLGVWGPNGTRVVAAESYWRQPRKWDRDAAKAGERRRVFCASLADVFENWQGPLLDSNNTELCACHECGKWMYFNERECDCRNDRLPRRLTLCDVRRRLFDLIQRTPNLDWLLLTKRSENALKMMVSAGLYAVENPSLPCPQPNLWLGVSVEDQQRADERIPHLLRTPAAVRFLSCEPLLSVLDLRRFLTATTRYHLSLSVDGALRNREFVGLTDDAGEPMSKAEAKAALEQLQAQGVKQIPSSSGCDGFSGETGCPGHRNPAVDWVIVGGESGPGARPMDVAWARSLVEQCKAAAVPVFVKQMGSMPFDSSQEFCRFESEQQWVCKARSWLGGISGGGTKYKAAEKVICVDAKGRRCEMGRDFMRATAEGAYPVRAYPQLRLWDRKGGDINEFPADLRVREFPTTQGQL